MNINNLHKDILSVINPPVWDAYHYVGVITRKAYEKAISGILKNNEKYNILDYGCGVRPYKYIFGNHINRYVGVDIGENPKADILIEPGDKLPVTDNEFDIVLSSQVLEHVENVEQYLNECYRVLKPNGYLLLSTHGTWQFHASPHDYNRWTIMGLKVLMNRFHFDLENVYPILGQLALTSQLRLSFFNSFANMLGFIGKVLLFPVSIFYQLKMRVEDAITPRRVKERDSAIFLLVTRKKT